MKVDLDPEQIIQLTEHLREIINRYEAEAAALSTVGGETGRALAAERLEQAAEAHALWEFLTDL